MCNETILYVRLERECVCMCTVRPSSGQAVSVLMRGALRPQMVARPPTMAVPAGVCVISVDTYYLCEIYIIYFVLLRIKCYENSDFFCTESEVRRPASGQESVSLSLLGDSLKRKREDDDYDVA